MTETRRTFLKTGATAVTAATALAAVPRLLFARATALSDPVSLIEDPRVKQLTLRGIDAARTAGATYADIRLTHLKTREWANDEPWIDHESMTVGVRALVDGYWGFASGPVWSGDEMVRLARVAVDVAKTNALGKSRSIELAPVPMIRDGQWIMPVRIDPFEVPRAEMRDFMMGLVSFVKQWRDWEPKQYGCKFVMVDKSFGSTDGSYCVQRTYCSHGTLSCSLEGKYSKQAGNLNDYLSPAGRGWELFLDQPLREGIRQLHEELQEDASFPVKPVDVGRYDTVLSASTLVQLLNGSIGAATQLDRVMGYEANAGGTSYITDPEVMLGALKIGAPHLTVTANRSAPGAAATVKWDDEGVEPDTFTLVQNGVLTDLQTTRESAGWMRGWPAAGTGALRSHGCANAPEAVDAPLAHTPNLVMTPGQEALDFAALVAGLTKGLVIKRGGIEMDFQQLNGYGQGSTFEVKNGKRVAVLASAGVLLRAPEFWSSLLSIGGANSTIRYGTESGKGEPPQSVINSVDVVPVVVRDLTIIDVLRKA